MTSLKTTINIPQNSPDEIYAILFGGDWDEIKIYLSKSDAIKASEKHPDKKIAIFRKPKPSSSGYSPTTESLSDQQTAPTKT